MDVRVYVTGEVQFSVKWVTVHCSVKERSHSHEILATLISQFRQEMAFVMQTTHAQWRQYSDWVDKCLIFPVENVHMYYKNHQGPV